MLVGHTAEELGWGETREEKTRQGSSNTMRLLWQHYHVQTGCGELVLAEMAVCNKFELSTGIKKNQLELYFDF